MKKLLYVALLGISLNISAISFSLTKNEKTQLDNLVEPMKKIEQKINEINQAATQIQNFIVENYNQSIDQELKDQYHRILNQLAHISLLLEALAYVIQAQVQLTQDLVNQVSQLQDQLGAVQEQVANLQAVIGSPSDLSVGEEEFNSVQDIDDAELSVISWLKSIYREQLYNKFIS